VQCCTLERLLVLIRSWSISIYIPDLSKDWRYRGNPYADKLKGMKSYVGRTVSLGIESSAPNEAHRVPVGVINLMQVDTQLPPLTVDQRKVLEHVRRMLETQLMATWEGHVRSKEAQARRAVSNLLESKYFTLQSSLKCAQTAGNRCLLFRGTQHDRLERCCPRSPVYDL